MFGGISGGTSCDSLVELDVVYWRWRLLQPSGDAPGGRFGCTLAQWGGRLWVVGGGWGSDLLRSGDDLGDVYCLHLAKMVRVR